jgi:predicted lysophospholipase L1 biosynthesis ABC-type transport system permease subunit
VAEKLSVFDYVKEPNLFLVKTSNGFFEDDLNQALALEIQTTLNDLDNPSSLSFRMGVLVGATTRLIHAEMAALWENEAAFWDFLATFASIGLVIGAAGMAIIAMRSVSERMREIGMMRAIGFSRSKVVYSIIIEMFFLGLFGLITGIINGLLMSYMFARNIFEVKMEIPYDVLGIYTGIILGVALLSAILPGVRASRIPPSQALRYTG